MNVAPPKHSYTQRYCCTFGGKMHWNPIWRYRFSGAHMVWWTQWSPDRPDDDNSCWRELLKANHWLDQTSREWVGPPSLPPEATRRGRGRVQPGARKQDTWLLLRENPEVFTDLQGNPSPISLVASQVCCDHAGGWLKAIDLSERVRGCRKKHIMMYKKRCFCSEDEAGFLFSKEKYNQVLLSCWFVVNSYDAFLLPQNSREKRL